MTVADGDLQIDDGVDVIDGGATDHLDAAVLERLVGIARRNP